MDAAPPPDLKALLTSTKISQLISNTKPLVALSHTVNVGAVLETLSSHHLLAAPIFVADEQGRPRTSVAALVGFVDVWAVLSAFLQSVAATAPACGTVTAEALEEQGAALCARPVLSLFDGTAARAAIEAGDLRGACADWDVHGDPDSSLLEVIRSCFLPRAPQGASSLVSWSSGAGFAPSLARGGAPAGSPAGSATPAPAPTGHSRHPAASHRIVVARPSDGGGQQLAVLSQTDVLRFLAAHHESLRPLGKASLAELGLATGSLHLAAGPPNNSSRLLPPLSPSGGGGGGGAANHPAPGIPPSSPKPPLSGGGLLGSLSGIPASPSAEGGGSLLLQRAGSGPAAGGGGAAPMQMSPPASPRVSAGGAYGLSALGGGHHRPAARRQLVAVHESVTALEAFRVLLQQRVSAVAVLAGQGPSVNMRLVGNLSASDLRHLGPGHFARLALSVKEFLAGNPLAPDQAIPLAMPPPPAAGGAAPPPRPPVLMAHAPGVFTCQATATLDELVRLLGAPGRGIHRVYVADCDQRPAGIVTGTDVLALASAACSRD